MASLRPVAGTTEDWKSVSGDINCLILKERELALEELEDGSYNVRLGDGKSKFFDLHILFNMSRAETIYDKVSSATDVLDRAIAATNEANQAKTDAETAARAVTEAIDGVMKGLLVKDEDGNHYLLNFEFEGGKMKVIQSGPISGQ